MMNKSDRLKALQQRLAKLQLGKAQAAPPVVSPDGIPPIRIEVAIKAIGDGAQYVSDRATPSPS